jgi:hypothetical protein
VAADPRHIPRPAEVRRIFGMTRGKHQIDPLLPFTLLDIYLPEFAVPYFS